MPTDESASRLSDLDRLRLAAIVESSDDAIVSKDLDGTIRSWNPAAERIFGYPAAAMVGQPIFRLIPPELHDEEQALLARIRAGEHVAHYETTRIRQDGQRLRISLTLSPVWTPDGRLIGASAIKRDVTGRCALERQLQQAQRLETIGRLAGGVAHDFNNLLTVIGGLTGLLMRRHAPGSRDHRDLEQVALAVERASALTQQLLTFSRREAVDLEVLDPNQIALGLEPMLRRLIGEHIALRTSLALELGRVRTNRSQLEQVMVNLALNARDAMPEGGTLTIETENVDVTGVFAQEQLRLPPGPYVVVAVSDTGVGMDAVTLANVFEPFFTTKPLGEGTGLGLTTVFGIVQQVGGTIYVYSEPGHGSVFKVYLPRVDARATAPLPPEPSALPVDPNAVRATILLVEDEPAVRSFACRVLEDAGYHVLEAGNGRDALALAGRYEGRIDLLLTDVVLSDMNGRALGDYLGRTCPDTPVLYTSGYTDDMVVRTGVVTAGAAFMQKPFTTQGLLEHVRSMLQQSHRPASPSPK